MTEYKYEAFISYSHADRKWAKWLQRKLESYKPPKSANSTVVFGRVFRDEDELSVSSDLSDRINKALRSSEKLIVICSQIAASSKWVNAEVQAFQEQGKGDRVFCLIVGDSQQSDRSDCFPPALLQKNVEPLAADLSASSANIAFLKLYAGLSDVDFEELRQRQAKSRQLRLMVIAATSTVGMILALSLAIFAFYARQQAVVAQENAELRRTQAEDLINFMLGDLRKRLEPVGRLEVLDQVGDKAMEYFGSLRPQDMNDQALLQRARALRQIGEVRNAQGQLDAAAESFLESKRILTLARERNPANPDVLFELAQSHFWVADIYYHQNDFPAARSEISRYRDIAEELVRIKPDNDDYQLEYAYAASNLATLDYDIGRYQSARQGFLAALEVVQALRQKNPQDSSLVKELAGTYAWLGTVSVRLHELKAAQQMHQQSLELWREIASDSDKISQVGLGDVLNIVAGDYYRLGQLVQAVDANQEAVEVFSSLVSYDPSNQIWQGRLAVALSRLAGTYLAQGRIDDAGRHLQMAESVLKKIGAESGNADFREKWWKNQILTANYLRTNGKREQAIAKLEYIENSLESASKSVQTDRLFAAARYLLAQTWSDQGDAIKARAIAGNTLDLLEGNDEPEIELYATIIALRFLAGKDYDEQLDRLVATGFVQPGYWSNTTAAQLLSRLGSPGISR